MASPAEVSTARPASSQSQGEDSAYQSWGRFPRASHRAIYHAFWPDQLPRILQHAEPASLLPYGKGRSYGDSCLNHGRDLVDCSGMDRILDADWASGMVRVEGGVSLAELLAVIVPRGWFLPVTPGTKFVTIGGAIANDVHGKNHHRAGTFGRHVRELLLRRSDRGAVQCSPQRETELFGATVAGLGLTGVIEWADLQLKPIAGSAIEVETLRFRGLRDFAALTAESDRKYEYTVAWLDCSSGRQMRGLFYRGNHGKGDAPAPSARGLAVPFDCPSLVLSTPAVGIFNAAYYSAKSMAPRKARVHYDPFFYPLDALQHWNRLYGRGGLVQYQCVVPHRHAESLNEMLGRIRESGHGSFLAVLKTFGDVPSPGWLSFPRPGLTLALDLPMRGASTLALLDGLDEILALAGGTLYPAKDARMSAATFQSGFPQWRRLRGLMDPKYSSSFWRRVTKERA